MIWLPHLGQPTADTSKARGTLAGAISAASSASSHAAHSSASLRILSATALADPYVATFSRARATSSSLKSVRRSFRGYCGVRGAEGMVVGCVAGGGAAPAVSGNNGINSATISRLARITTTLLSARRPDAISNLAAGVD